jgi:hypothetical protein
VNIYTDFPSLYYSLAPLRAFFCGGMYFDNIVIIFDTKKVLLFSSEHKGRFRCRGPELDVSGTEDVGAWWIPLGVVQLSGTTIIVVFRDGRPQKCSTCHLQKERDLTLGSLNCSHWIPSLNGPNLCFRSRKRPIYRLSSMFSSTRRRSSPIFSSLSE